MSAKTKKAIKWMVGICILLVVISILTLWWIRAAFIESTRPTRFYITEKEWVHIRKDPYSEWLEAYIIDRRLKYLVVFDNDYSKQYIMPQGSETVSTGLPEFVTTTSIRLYPGQSVGNERVGRAEFYAKVHKR